MNFIEAIQSGFRNVLDFGGRASRSEYNFWLLFLFILFTISIEIEPPTPGLGQYDSESIEEEAFDPDFSRDPLFEPFNSRLFSFVYFVVFLPTMSLTIRRFHDIGKSGWYILLPITIIGIIPYHYWTCISKGDCETNLYGKNPLNANSNDFGNNTYQIKSDRYDNTSEEE